MAAIKGANLQKYVSKITTTLDATTQGEIAGIIKKVRNVSSGVAYGTSDKNLRQMQ